MAPHVKSKRRTLRHKHKVAKKVRQHHKQVRRENRNKPEVRRIKSKDPGIPNLWPHKQQLLEAIEQKKVQDAEARKANIAARKEALRAAKEEGVDPSLLQVVADAKMRERDFEARQAIAANANTSVKTSAKEGGEIMSADSSKRAFMKEFKKVVDSSDVILEVLDARDPMGCRCYAAERAIFAASGGAKRIILVLNKVDMVPKEVTDKWLAFLRNDFPTVAFRASVQEGRGKGQAKMSALAASSVNTSECLGASNLLSLLKNYARSRNLKTSIAVGVIGYPNVGKSSLINSLKRSRAVNAGAAPGVTRSAQEVHLDKDIRLIDCPGIVFSSNQADALVLRNCIKIENLYDAVSPVDTIINRVGKEPLMIAYGVPKFDSTAEFLACICSLRGNLKTGGVFDTNAAARRVLQDWNSGKIPFYTLPPRGPRKAHLGASIVEDWSNEFDINAIRSNEKAQLDSLNMSATRRVAFASANASIVNEDSDFDGIGEEIVGVEDNEEMELEDVHEEGEKEVESGERQRDNEPTYHIAERTAGAPSSAQKRKHQLS